MNERAGFCWSAPIYPQYTILFQLFSICSFVAVFVLSFFFLDKYLCLYYLAILSCISRYIHWIHIYILVGFPAHVYFISIFTALVLDLSANIFVYIYVCIYICVCICWIFQIFEEYSVKIDDNWMLMMVVVI